MSDELINAEHLARVVTTTAEQLADGTRSGRVRPWVSTRLEHDVQAVSTFEQYGQRFVMRCDESVDRAGRGSAPSPMRYLLNGVAFCLQVWCAKSCVLADVSVDRLQVDVRTLLDMRGEHLVDDVPPHPQWFVLDVAIDSDASSDRVLAAVQDAARRCPITSLVAQAVPVYLIVRHNGDVIHDARPDELSTEHEEVSGR